MKIVESETKELHTEPYEPDLQGIIQSIKDAERQADIVLCTHHGHQDDGCDRHIPAKFIETFARACIDAGAHAFLGHGPHVLRGIEIYKSKPILYSLGNFIFQSEAIKRLGQDYYNRYNLGIDATPADAYDVAEDRGKINWKGWAGHALEAPEWDSLAAEITFNGRKLVDLRLHPATLGFGLPRYAPERGRPMRATLEDSERIIDLITRYSKPCNTKIELDKGVGIVSL